MQKTLRFDDADYTYRLTANIGGIYMRLYEPEGSDITTQSGLRDRTPTTDLQGFSCAYEDVTSAPPSVIRTVLISHRLQPQVIRLDSGSYILQGPRDKPGFIGRLHYILHAISEEARVFNLGQCTLHAAAIKLSGTEDGVLILGDKGSGKTITTYAACRLLGAELIGNDLVVVGIEDNNELYLHSGSTHFLLRKGISLATFPELKGLLSADEFPRQTDYENKGQFTASELGLVTVIGKLLLKMVVRVNVHPSASQNALTSTFARNTEALRLHEGLARYIRGQTTPVCIDSDGTISGFFQPLDSPETQTIRNRMVSALLGLSYVYITATTPQQSAALLMQAAQCPKGGNA